MMLDVIPMPWDFPVEVNNLEAEAFCNWKSGQIGKKLRLISHEESLHMRQIAKKQTSNSNLNRYASPTPVNLFGGMINGKKVFDISGNVWRHSVSVLTIMEGFKMDPSLVVLANGGRRGEIGGIIPHALLAAVIPEKTLQTHDCLRRHQ